MNEVLSSMGWSERLHEAWVSCTREGMVPGRVVRAERERFVVWTEHGERPATLGGRLRHEALDAADLPVVGDWVALSLDGESGVVRRLLPRWSVFVRKAAGTGARAQLVAANVDAVFLVLAMNGDFNLRRLERYLAAAWESGAEPVVVLTKRDLALDPDALTDAARAAAPGASVVAVSAPRGDGLDALAVHLRAGATVALIGSSGAGKSTLLNALAGAEVMSTGGLRERDERGRHTTTHRELVRLPSGALLIDTPGMRELGMWEVDEGVSLAFDDVAALAEECRFRDCAHAGEAGCAVAEALAEGALSEARFASYQKLAREAAFQARRSDPRLAAEARAKWKRVSVAARRSGKGRDQ